MVRVADADGSGEIDFYEFVTLMAHKMEDADDDRRTRAAFSLFDHSGDGYIDEAELRNIMINVGEPVTIEDCRGVLRELDRDGDGRINYEEFCEIIGERAVNLDGSKVMSASEHLRQQALLAP
jgi:calmodulin